LSASRAIASATRERGAAGLVIGDRLAPARGLHLAGLVVRCSSLVHARPRKRVARGSERNSRHDDAPDDIVAGIESVASVPVLLPVKV
jgi:hypothetical protein